MYIEIYYETAYNGTFKKLNRCRNTKRGPVEGNGGIDACKVGIGKSKVHGQIHIVVIELENAPIT